MRFANYLLTRQPISTRFRACQKVPSEHRVSLSLRFNPQGGGAAEKNRKALVNVVRVRQSQESLGALGAMPSSLSKPVSQKTRPRPLRNSRDRIAPGGSFVVKGSVRAVSGMRNATKGSAHSPANASFSSSVGSPSALSSWSSGLPLPPLINCSSPTKVTPDLRTLTF